MYLLKHKKAYNLNVTHSLKFLPKKSRILTRAQYGNVVRVPIFNPKAQTPRKIIKNKETQTSKSRKCQKQLKDTKFKMFVTKPDLQSITRKI